MWRDPALYEIDPKLMIDQLDVSFERETLYLPMFHFDTTTPMISKLKVRHLIFSQLSDLKFYQMRNILNLYIDPLESLTIEFTEGLDLNRDSFFGFL